MSAKRTVTKEFLLSQSFFVATLEWLVYLLQLRLTVFATIKYYKPIRLKLNFLIKAHCHSINAN